MFAYTHIDHLNISEEHVNLLRRVEEQVDSLRTELELHELADE